MKKMISNKIQCKYCNEIIESKHVHDFRYCKCKKVYVDGGLQYAKRGFPKWPPEEHYIELSEYKEEIDND